MIFSVQKVKEINKIISLIKSGIFSIIIIVIIFLLILLIQTFKYIAIKRTAYIDKLTNVYNRNYLQESEDFINLGDYILATLDIDHFKTVNDTFGHDVGDKILKDVAHIILMTSRTKDDIVIRYGGEEFVILSKITRDNVLSALNVIERIHKNIQEHKFYYTKNEYMEVTVSIGVNLVPGKSRTFSDAFKLADIALYNAKNRGRNNIQIYDDVDSQLDTTMMSINDIKDAIEDDRIICYYQKIVDNNTNEVCHYEALLRIIDNKGNVISPDKILPRI
uniref:diguanylate cyclase n=1 Tax=Aliarcobacter sp. TaxID=2321116 RepID=UPI004047C660